MLLLRLAALAAFLFLPGCLAVSLLCGEGRLDWAERLFLSAVCGCALAALAGAALGLASRFAPRPLLACWAALCLALLAAARRRLGWLLRAEWRSLAALLLLAAAGLALFLPPGRVVFGWNDEGIYPNIAALMREEGRIHTSVGIVEEVAPERRSLLFPENRDRRLPFQAYLYKQYFITDFAGGKVVPQFYYPWPSLMAAFAVFLGTARTFYAVTLAALLSLLGIYLLARRMLGGRWAWAAAAPAALSPLMLYFSRYTASEVFTMALFCGGCLALLAALREGPASRGTGEAALAALLFTAGLLTRIDFSLLLPPVLLAFFWRRMSGAWGRADAAFTAALLAGFALSVPAGRFFSAPYFFSIFHYGLGGRGRALASAALAAAAALAVLSFFPRQLRGAAGRLARRKRLWKALAWAALAAAFIFLYFIRPRLGGGEAVYTGFNTVTTGPSYNPENLVRWGWWFSFPGLLLVFCGYGLALTSERERSWSPVLASGLALTLFYLWDMRCTPLQIMVMRRVMPVIFPVGMLMAAYALKRLFHWPAGAAGAAWRRALRPLGGFAAGLLLFYLAAFYAVTARPILGLSEGGNQREAVEAVGAAAAEGTVLMDYNAGELFGPPLLSFAGRPNASLTGNRALRDEAFPALLSDLGFPERPVYLLWRPAASGTEIDLAEGLGLEYVTAVAWQEENLKTSFTSRPDARVSIDEAFVLYRFTRP